MCKWFLIIFSFLLSYTSLIGQSEERKQLHTFVLLGYQVGGQGENRNFVTKNGPGLHLSLHYPLSPKISAGLGIGYAQLEKERFIPVFAEAIAHFKETQSSPYLKVRIGGSSASNSDLEQFESYDFDGGLYFSAGWGYRFPIAERLALLIELNIEFQQAELEFNSFSSETFEEDFQYYFLAFKTGIKF